jgi:hypothetical protein
MRLAGDHHITNVPATTPFGASSNFFEEPWQMPIQDASIGNRTVPRSGIVKFTRDMKVGGIGDGFGIEILYPGAPLDIGDSGLAAIGRIDQARIPPGHTIRMHPHRDDEILTYIRVGGMRHTDTEGHVEEIGPARLMLMNAGHTFRHEETMLPPVPLECLQIFIRPSAAGLDPMVQFHEFDEVHSRDVWRLVGGPAAAPLVFRSTTWVHDVRVSGRNVLALPAMPVPEALRLLYVFKGSVSVEKTSLTTGQAAILPRSEVAISAGVDSDLVLFTTDPAGAFFTGGMFSGNVSENGEI